MARVTFYYREKNARLGLDVSRRRTLAVPGGLVVCLDVDGLLQSFRRASWAWSFSDSVLIVSKIKWGKMEVVL